MLANAFAGQWHLGGVAVGKAFVYATLASEGALLFVAAQTGFIDGPRVMANMAVDSWLPVPKAARAGRRSSAWIGPSVRPRAATASSTRASWSGSPW